MLPWLLSTEVIITETAIFTADNHIHIFTLILTETLCSNLVRKLGNFTSILLSHAHVRTICVMFLACSHWENVASVC